MASDQTDRDSMLILQEAHQKDAKSALGVTGTGVFVIADPAAGIGKYAKVIVPELSYEEVRRRGAECIAFSWVAPQVKSVDDIRAAGCAGVCFGACPPGCICVGFTGANSGFCA